MEPTQALLAYAEMYRAQIALGAGVFLVMLLGTLAVVGLLLVKMPADYLESPEDTPFWPGRPAWQRVLARVGKNVLGVLIVALGVVLSVPGVPGQGVLTILIGLMLLDIPGKRRFERGLLGRRRVLAAVNRLRARFGRPPLVGPPPPSAR